MAKILVTTEFRLRLIFGFLKAISYGYGVSEKILFRSHTNLACFYGNFCSRRTTRKAP